MKVLILNGSPRGEKSNTLCLTNAFTEGMREKAQCDIETVNVISENISPCRGCFSCWTKTPGKCVIRDGMDKILPKFIEADVVIWSFPLYYFGMPSQIKALMDRLLPLNLPFMEKCKNGGYGHPPRYEQLKSKRHVLISTCGFYSKTNNYEALTKQFEIAFGSYGQNPAMLLCPEGELFKVPQLKQRTDEYLSYVCKSGAEYAANSVFSTETQEKLDEPLFPPEVYAKMANASWDIASPASSANTNAPSPSQAHTLLKEMSALYDPSFFNGNNTVIEFYFTDRNETYQMVLEKSGASVKESGFTDYTTRIETPFTVWNDISIGKLNGAEAMMEHKYKVLGDFKTMLHLNDYFSVGGESANTAAQKSDKSPKKTCMNLLLMPWIALWIFMPINSILGGLAGVIASAAMPLFGLYFKLTIYDCIGAFFIGISSAAALAGAPAALIVVISYVAFGIMWGISCFLPVPISAWYSANDYGGPENALNNPLFVKTNRILTACWAALYLITPVWTIYLMSSPYTALTGLINSVFPAIMGIFTLRFQRWYPAKVAAGK